MTTPPITENKLTIAEFLDFVQSAGNNDKHWEFDCVVVPDLAVKVLTNKQNFFDTFQMIQSCLIAGTHYVWVISSKLKTVFVWKRGTGASLIVDEFNLEATLTGGDVLPDFALAVKDIFPE
jgi:Uma2 family endonuclease